MLSQRNLQTGISRNAGLSSNVRASKLSSNLVQLLSWQLQGPCCITQPLYAFFSQICTSKMSAPSQSCWPRGYTRRSTLSPVLILSR